jgi:hypothetical protein
LDSVKLDIQNRAYYANKFSHEKITTLPVFDYYYSNSSSYRQRFNPQATSNIASDDDIAIAFKQKLRADKKSSFTVGEDFWEMDNHKVHYEKSSDGKRRFRVDNIKTNQARYEEELYNEVQAAIEKVNAQYQKQFVKYINTLIQQADPLVQFVNSKVPA